MMPLPIGPLVSIMFSMIFMLTLVTARYTALAIFIVACTTLAALFLFLRRNNGLPGWMMDILDRFTDKAALERAYAERRHLTAVIDADALYKTLKAKVVGQDRTLRSRRHATETAPHGATPRQAHRRVLLRRALRHRQDAPREDPGEGGVRRQAEPALL